MGLLALAGRWFDRQTNAVIPIGKILRSAPWQVVVFSLGNLVVTGLRNAGLTAILSHSLEQLSHRGFSLAALGMGFLATLLSAVMNNLPTVLINAIAIQDAAGIHPHIQQAMVYANAIGCDIGAKITPTGSLSTLLWLHVLDRKGIRIRWSQYLRISFILTLPVLFVTLLSLVLWLPWVLA